VTIYTLRKDLKFHYKYCWMASITQWIIQKANLINKHQHCPGARKRMAQLAKCLTHKPCLKCNMGISHLTIQFSFWNKSCYFLRTLSTTTTSIEPLRIKISARPRACSPQSGWDNNRCSALTPIDSANVGSRACSASIKAQYPETTKSIFLKKDLFY
jgi:hypothetical protein